MKQNNVFLTMIRIVDTWLESLPASTSEAEAESRRHLSEQASETLRHTKWALTDHAEHLAALEVQANIHAEAHQSHLKKIDALQSLAETAKIRLDNVWSWTSAIQDEVNQARHDIKARDGWLNREADKRDEQIADLMKKIAEEREARSKDAAHLQIQINALEDRIKAMEPPFDPTPTHDENLAEEGYNGWKNYETWCVHLRLTNEPKTEKAARDAARLSLVPTASMRGYVEGLLWRDAPTGLAADLVMSALDNVDWRAIVDAFKE